VRLQATRVNVRILRPDQKVTLVGEYRLAIDEARVLAQPDAWTEKYARDPCLFVQFAESGVLKTFTGLGAAAWSEPVGSNLRMLGI